MTGDVRSSTRALKDDEPMYSMIIEPNASVHFSLHAAPDRLTPDDARRALAAVEPVLDALRRRAGADEEAPAPLSAASLARGRRVPASTVVAAS